MLVGDNGVLNKAQDANKKTNKEKVREKVGIEVMGSYDETGMFQMDKLKGNIKSHLGVKEGDITDNEDGGITFPLEGYTVTVDKDGKISIEGDGTKEPSIPENDTTPPEILTAIGNADGTITVTAKDEGGSGIGAYAVTTENTAPEESSTDWKASTSETWTSEKKEDGVYYVWVRDGEKNVSTEEKQVNVEELESATTLKDKLDGTNGKDSVLGKKVTGLTTTFSNKYEWKIFYIDSNYIYLIASNYLQIDDYPIGQGGYTVIKDDRFSSLNEFGVQFDNIIKGYSGSSDIVDDEMKALNEKLFKINNYTSSDDEMKRVAYLLDRDIWTQKFTGAKAGNTQIKYVVGAPSIEILFNSYNAKYKTNYKTKIFDKSSVSSGYRNRILVEFWWRF